MGVGGNNVNLNVVCFLLEFVNTFVELHILPRYEVVGDVRWGATSPDMINYARSATPTPKQPRRRHRRLTKKGLGAPPPV